LLSLLPAAVGGAVILSLLFVAFAELANPKGSSFYWDRTLRTASLLLPFALGVGVLAAAVCPAPQRSNGRLRAWITAALPVAAAPLYTIAWCAFFWPYWTSQILFTAMLAGLCLLCGGIAAAVVTGVAARSRP
jgi:hypothetical protein